MVVFLLEFIRSLSPAKVEPGELFTAIGWKWKQNINVEKTVDTFYRNISLPAAKPSFEFTETMSSPTPDRKTTTRTLIWFVYSIFLAFVLGYLFQIYAPRVLQSLFLESNPMETAGPHQAGRWRYSRSASSDRTTLLKGLPYLAGSQPAPEEMNVTRLKQDLVQEGLNLVVSGHGPEAYLMDLTGTTLHTWQYDFAKVWPDYVVEEENKGHDSFWRRVHLLGNGDLLAIYEGIGLIKIDLNSQLLWAYRGGCHHDLDVDADGLIYVLTRVNRINPQIHETESILEEFITVLTPAGIEISRVSIVSCLLNSDYAPLLSLTSPTGDFLHTNTLTLLKQDPVSKSLPPCSKCVLISMRYLNTVAIVDLHQNRIVWALTGLWQEQHQPILLDSGHLLVFDNIGPGQYSQVVEIEPRTQKIVWVANKQTGHYFYSRTCGSNQRLRNGNTLITVSDRGRAFEITTEGLIAWEYYNPHRAGKQNELIATLFEVIRLEPEVVQKWYH